MTSDGRYNFRPGATYCYVHVERIVYEDGC
jgi:hypothetical protein